jgi:hypothetical protein
MYRREHRDQLSFKDFFLPFGGQLSGDNRWIKLAELIPLARVPGSGVNPWGPQPRLRRRAA